MRLVNQKLWLFCSLKIFLYFVLLVRHFLKQKFKNKFISITTDITDWEKLLCMSCCNHNIIANSSFSWWGAYFNKNTEKKIYYPSQWFGKKLSYHN